MTILGLAPCLEPTKPAHFNIENVIRPNILALHPYRCARDDYQQGILLDANENALGHSIQPSPNMPQELQVTLGADLHRYPDPSHDEIKSRIAALRGLPDPKHVFLGVGSDEVIDLIMRVCVVPAQEKILITPPTYGMYAVSAQVNDIGIVRCPLNLSGSAGEGGDKGRFSLVVDAVRLFSHRRTYGVDPSTGKSSRDRGPSHQTRLSLFARKPNWDIDLPRRHPFPARVRAFQRDRRRRRSLHRLCGRGRVGRIARQGLCQHLRDANAEQKLWARCYPVRTPMQ